VAEVSLAHVGPILGVEMSRWPAQYRLHRLLEVCALFHTLLADLDGYDPGQYNDRLLA
jgi:hypothetical protein